MVPVSRPVARHTGVAPVPSVGRSGLVDAVAALVGSQREAAWIVEHAERAGSKAGVSTGETALVLAERRAAGEPLQYVLGSWPFRTIELEVDRRVLIPRPETEQVVGAALGELARLGELAASPPANRRTGRWSAWTSGRVRERSPSPSPQKRRQRGRSRSGRPTRRATPWTWPVPTGPGSHGVTRRRPPGSPWPGATGSGRSPPHWPARSTWWSPTRRMSPGSSTQGSIPRSATTSPRAALVAGPGTHGGSGTAAIEAVVAGSARWLRPSGGLVVELAPSQAPFAVEAARRAGFSRVRAERDLAGRLRMLVAER